MTITEKFFALKSVPPFDRLRDSELALLAEVARVRRFAPGETVCAPERPLQRLLVVVQGGIAPTAGGGATDVLGVAALLFGVPIADTYTASPATGATCLLVSKGHFHTTVRECPELVAAFLDRQIGL
jgi:signal-transduction protein with cAMP-binding, CBS, and nucleotidyltransferase domain